MAKNKSKAMDVKYVGLVQGVISAMVLSILAVLIYAVLLKTFAMSDKSIPYFNQVVKILGILTAAFYGTKKSGSMLFGMFGGVSFVILAFLLFSLVGGGLGSIPILISDLVMGAVIGLVFAIIIMKLGAGKEQARR